ncbi:MAG TPA: GDSL-type esterase/lipase family protein [Bacteroidales bacterium]|nr:GDSL-type esterase/lipase family protein [Bacteroidales bacterium]
MKKCLAVIVVSLILMHHMAAQYPFIRYDLNTIVLPNDSSAWIKLANKMHEAKTSGKLNIVHFGDSHIQGDYFTGEVRKNLFNYLKTNTRSRGITMPYSVAGTNGPDELSSSSKGAVAHGCVRKGPANYYALTGYSIYSTDTLFTISIKDTIYSFNKVFVFHSVLKGQEIRLNTKLPSYTKEISDSLAVSVFKLPELLAELKLEVTNRARVKTSIYGFSLENYANTVLYNNIGVNGATFGTFLKMQNQEELIKLTDPDCVIFSYGTNDALNGRLDSALLKSQIQSCINTIRKGSPGVPIIFTTPGDYLISKKYVNPKTVQVANIIKRTALRNGCAYWDFHEVMGGAGSVKDWYKNQFVYKDWIHLSKKGYRFQGDLFFEALLKFSKINKTDE